jgi:type II secretory pathway component PulC
MFTNLVRNGIILEWGDREAVALMEERGTTKTFYGTLEHYEPTGNLLEYMKKKFRKGVEVHYHGKKNRGTVEEVTDTEVVVNFKGRIKRIEIKEFFAYGCLVKTNFLFWQEKTHVG